MTARPPASWPGLSGGVAVSRTSGVAPLSVFFDAQGLAGLDPAEVQDAEFLWSFGDSDAPFDASGFFVAHAYRYAGTYEVRLEVRAPGGRMIGGTVATIEVAAEPEGGWRTVFVAADGDDGNPGHAPSAPLRTLAAGLARLGPGARVLLRRGDVWEARGLTVDRVAGPAMLGAYGEADAPAPVVRHPDLPAAPGNAPPILYRNCTDFRVVGLAIEGNAPRAGGPLCHGIRAHGCPDFLALDCTIARTGTAVFYYRDSPRMLVADSTIDECSGYGAYGGNVLDAAFAGNAITRLDGGEHGLRFQRGRNAFVSGNRFAAARDAKSSFTFREDLAGVVFAGNVADRVASLVPYDGRGVSRVTIERNELSSLSVTNARDVSIRNNRGGPIQLRREAGSPGPENVAVYANTLSAREHVILSQLDGPAMRAAGIRVFDNAIVVGPDAPGYYRWPFDGPAYAGAAWANHVHDRRTADPSPFADDATQAPDPAGPLASGGVPTHLSVDLDGRTRPARGRAIGARVPNGPPARDAETFRGGR